MWRIGRYERNQKTIHIETHNITIIFCYLSLHIQSRGLPRVDGNHAVMFSDLLMMIVIC